MQARQRVMIFIAPAGFCFGILYPIVLTTHNNYIIIPQFLYFWGKGHLRPIIFVPKRDSTLTDSKEGNSP
jgi:hypothetical protein